MAPWTTSASSSSALAAERARGRARRPGAGRRAGAGEGRARARPSRYGDLVRRRARGQPARRRAVFATEGGLDPETGQGIGSVHWHQAAGAAEVEVDLETGRVEVLALPRRRLRRPDRQPGPGRAPDRGQHRLRPRPGAVRGDGLRRRPAPERQPRRLHDREHRGHARRARPRRPGAPRGERDPRHRRDRRCRRCMPAIGNAVYRATGVRITDLPITPEKVLRGLRAAASQESQRMTDRRHRRAGVPARAARRRRQDDPHAARQRPRRARPSPAPPHAPRRAPQRARPDRPARGLRGRHVRRLHRPGRRPARLGLPPAGGPGRGPRADHDRGPRGPERRAPPDPAGLRRPHRLPVLVLHAGLHPGDEGAPRGAAERHPRGGHAPTWPATSAAAAAT